MTNNESIKRFAQRVFLQQSFSYKTLDEAKKTLFFDDYEYCFDALSLQKYYSTMDRDIEELFRREIFYLCHDRLDREEQKKLIEYGTLFKYLTSPNCQYHSYIITKKEQPDFDLQGNVSVGIEVVSFVTETDGVLYSISNENFQKGKTAQEIEKAAIEKHGSKAKVYSYTDINGSTAIGSPIFDCHKKREIFAETIAKKFQKYSTIKNKYDVFILLCDALYEVSMYDKEDSDNVISMFSEKCSEISDFNICILRDGNTGIMCDMYEY